MWFLLLVYLNIIYIKEKKLNTHINYCVEMKLIPIIMDYCLLLFDALKFFLGVHLHGGGGHYLYLQKILLKISNFGFEVQNI